MNREWEILGDTLASYIGPIPRGLTIEFQRGNYNEPGARDKIRYRWEFTMHDEIDGNAIMQTSDPKATVRDLLNAQIDTLRTFIHATIDQEPPTTTTITSDVAIVDTDPTPPHGTPRVETCSCGVVALGWKGENAPPYRTPEAVHTRDYCQGTTRADDIPPHQERPHQ